MSFGESIDGHQFGTRFVTTDELIMFPLKGLKHHTSGHKGATIVLVSPNHISNFWVYRSTFSRWNSLYFNPMCLFSRPFPGVFWAFPVPGGFHTLGPWGGRTRSRRSKWWSHRSSNARCDGRNPSSRSDDLLFGTNPWGKTWEKHQVFVDGFGWFLYPDPQFLKIQEMAWMVSVSKWSNRSSRIYHLYMKNRALLWIKDLEKIVARKKHRFLESYL